MNTWRTYASRSAALRAAKRDHLGADFFIHERNDAFAWYPERFDVPATPDSPRGFLESLPGRSSWAVLSRDGLVIDVREFDGDMPSPDQLIGDAQAILRRAPAPDDESDSTPNRHEAEALKRRIESGEVRATEGRLMSIAAAGVMPPAPDFSADTHKPHRVRLKEVIELAEQRDATALAAYPIVPASSSPKAIDRYRRAAIAAITAGA